MKQIYQGEIFQITHDIRNGKTFERAKRSPGTRIIIDDGKRILLSLEFREELNAYDYRLSGGKVFNSLDEWLKYKDDSKSMEHFAKRGAIKEISEEVGIKADDIELIQISKCGATIEWDLYYYKTVGKITEKEQHLGEGEDITKKWVTYEECIKICMSGKFREDRSLGVLLKYLLNKITR